MVDRGRRVGFDSGLYSSIGRGRRGFDQPWSLMGGMFVIVAPCEWFAVTLGTSSVYLLERQSPACKCNIIQ